MEQNPVALTYLHLCHLKERALGDIGFLFLLKKEIFIPRVTDHPGRCYGGRHVRQLATLQSGSGERCTVVLSSLPLSVQDPSTYGAELPTSGWVFLPQVELTGDSLRCAPGACLLSDFIPTQVDVSTEGSWGSYAGDRGEMLREDGEDKAGPTDLPLLSLSVRVCPVREAWL